MKTYKSIKGSGVYFIMSITVLYDFLLILLTFLINSYEISSLLKLTLIVFNIYQFYYIIICGTLKYSMDDYNIYINSALGLKRVKIPFDSIQGYQKSKGHIKGVKLSGYGKNNFAIGRSVIDKIGSTYMFVTSTKNIIYLKTEDINYALSPESFGEFEKRLNENNLSYLEWDYKINKNIHLYKDPKFFIPFIAVAIIVSILTLNPIIMYLYGNMPAMMPLNFDSKFMAVRFGTGKQFAFKQMTYGLLNMAILFCMYHAADLCAKYDKRSSYKFIYIPLILSAALLAIQIRILFTFR